MFIRISETTWVNVADYPQVTIVKGIEEWKLQLWWLRDGALIVFEEFDFEDEGLMAKAAAKLA